MCVFLLSLVVFERNGTLYVYQVSQQFVCQFENLYSLTCTLSDYRGAQRFVCQFKNLYSLTCILPAYRGAQRFVLKSGINIDGLVFSLLIEALSGLFLSLESI